MKRWGGEEGWREKGWWEERRGGEGRRDGEKGSGRREERWME